MEAMPNQPGDPVPDTVALSADRAWLSAIWSDGRRVRLAAGLLRAACRCASCVRARADGGAADGGDVTIVTVQAHGPHVGRLVFSDGHDRGLYPWTYLLEIAAAEPALPGSTA